MIVLIAPSPLSYDNDSPRGIVLILVVPSPSPNTSVLPKKHYPPNCPRPIPSYPPHKTGNAAPHMRRANKRDRNLWSGIFSMTIRKDTMILNYVWNTPVAHYGIDTGIDQISPSPKWRSKFKSPPPAHIATKAAQELRKKDDLSSKRKRLRADVQKVLHAYLWE